MSLNLIGNVMLIQCAQLYPLEIPMNKPIKMAGETLTHAHTLLIRLIDESGREGWGEASAAPLMTGETLGTIAASTKYLVSKLMGKSMDQASNIGPIQDQVLYGNASAKSCHETALIDLFSQIQGVPLHKFLADKGISTGNGRLEMLHMLASGNLDSEIEEASALRLQGYRQWKIKVGSGDINNDLLRVGEHCKILQGDVVSADANQSLSVKDALAIAIEGKRRGLSFLEQPFAADMIEAMSHLYQTTHMPLCADESIQGLQDIIEHSNSHAAQGISLKLIKLGGTQAMLNAGRECLKRGMKINLACKVAETTISAAATAHVGFALGDVAWGFSMSNRYLASDICENPLVAVEGAVTVNQFTKPGLGFSPQLRELKEFASGTYPMREFRL